MNKSATAAAFACLILIGCSTRRNALLPQPPPPPRSDDFLDAIAAMKHSIAPIVCVQIHPAGDWDLRSIEGTAFFVSTDGAFITANHVIDALTAQNRPTPCPAAAVYIPEDGVWHIDRATFRVHYALFASQLCKRNPQLDLAYCPIFGNSLTLANGTKLSITPVQIDSAIPPDGTPVAFSGFPLSNTVPISSVGSIGGYVATPDRGTFTVMVDRVAWPGASGSPMYLQNGHVIGVVLARGIGDAVGLAYGRIARFISDVMPTPTTEAQK